VRCALVGRFWVVGGGSGEVDGSDMTAAAGTIAAVVSPWCYQLNIAREL
jgi:hypothetical protein